MGSTRGSSATVGRPELAGFFVVASLVGVWSWWALRSGAWFGVVLLPGAVLLCALLVVLCIAAPRLRRARLGVAPAIALGALIALGGWAALSALWSPAPDVAVADGWRTLFYAVAFGLGLWMAALLRNRSHLSLLPLAIAGAFAGVITVVGMIGTEAPGDFLEEGGTLQYPIGYRNANAAFFLIAFFPALGFAADRNLYWPLRGLALATSALCLALALLSQSRGSIPAGLIAIGVYIAFSPLRLRALCWLVLAVLPALAVIPALSDVFVTTREVGVEAVSEELRAAGRTVAWITAATLVLGLAAARFERVLPGLGSTSPRSNRPTAAGLAAAAIGALVVFFVAVGNPIDWTADRIDEFGAGTPDLTEERSRFTLNVASDRVDLWRVALDDARANPIRGSGAGGFESSYLLQRETPIQTARDAHSIGLELLGELGVPGLLLLLIALAAAAVGAVRSRAFGENRAALSAIALAASAYWFAHASIDWFWAYPALSAPVIALLGSACAPRGDPEGDEHPGSAAATEAASPGATLRPRVATRLGIAAAATVLALSAVPPFLSERYINSAYATWGDDLERAYTDLDRARDLNPLADAPLLAEGGIARAAGDRERAINAFREAARKRPEEWAGAYFLADLHARQQPQIARRWLERARRLNPLSPEVEELAAELQGRRHGRSSD